MSWWETMKEDERWRSSSFFFFFFYTASSSGERRSVMSLAAGQELLLRIDTDNNTQCMNYIIALAFVITSLLSVLSFHLWISTLSALQQSLSGRKKGEEEKWLGSPSKPGMKVILFFFSRFWHIDGALLQEWPFNAVYRKHTLFIFGPLKSKTKRHMRSWPLQLQDQPAWGTDRGAPRN